MKIGVVGHGMVGKAVSRFFSRVPSHTVHIYDKYLSPWSSDASKEAIEQCELVFICVPTPTGADGFTCDVSIVEEVVQWIPGAICLRSTIPPGTVDRLVSESGKAIGFSPEYLGEQPGHPWSEDVSCGFVIIGGEPGVRDVVARAYAEVLGQDFKFNFCSARTAEVCKYMENCFLATKVTFVNQFFDIATAFDVDYSELRNLWTLDRRVGNSHTQVTPQRGYGGRCLPKDMQAMIAAMRPFGGAPVLEAIHSYNTELHKRMDEAAAKEKNS